MRYAMPRSVVLCLIAAAAPIAVMADEPSEGLVVDWQNRMLTIRGPALPGDVTIHYLEAYCRPGSTDRDWSHTVIPHQSHLLERSDDGKYLVLRDLLADGVVVRHEIQAGVDEVTFRVVAHNPTDQPSQAHWAQPCVRVDRFTGCGRDDARERLPTYVRKCFLYIDGRLTRLPTTPWADQARYVYGQVYGAPGVDRNDLNPRPLSPLVPSCSLTGCYSSDEKMILAMAWEPYQEIFQGVIACLHCDFRIGGLEPGQTKQIRGKIYVVPADIDKLWDRFRRDFPEQAAR
ncbi:MAG: hypothetical protein KatS3mg110_3887 [Pirellulaceae bacterium]|nr:MAG: hypothetical protein KatS3mg110_3887 [Pirellulaceae bacterium]